MYFLLSRPQLRLTLHTTSTITFFYHKTLSLFFFFFNDTPTTEIYPLSLHDALPISAIRSASRSAATTERLVSSMSRTIPRRTPAFFARPTPSTLASGMRGRSPTTSAITAHVLVLPKSSPATSSRSRLTPHPRRGIPRTPCAARSPGARSGRRAPRRRAPSPPDL